MMYSPFGRSRDKQRWEIYIVQFDSYVYLSESPDTMIPLQTGLCGGTKKIPSFDFFSVPDTNLSAQLYLIRHS